MDSDLQCRIPIWCIPWSLLRLRPDAFDAIYGKDRTAREGVEVSEEATAGMENGNTSEAGDEEAEEDMMSAGPSGRSLDATSGYKKQKKCKYGGKRNRIESNCLSPDMLKDVSGQHQGISQHVDMMAEAMELLKDVHRHFQSVVQHASSMAVAIETFKDAHNRFKSVVQNVSTAITDMERFKDAHDHFQSITQNGRATTVVVECHTDLQERVSPEVQQNARVRAITEMQKLGFTGSEVVNAARVFAKEPNQIGMFLALPEIYRREYILQMLNGTVPPLPLGAPVVHTGLPRESISAAPGVYFGRLAFSYELLQAREEDKLPCY